MHILSSLLHSLVRSAMVNHRKGEYATGLLERHVCSYIPTTCVLKKLGSGMEGTTGAKFMSLYHGPPGIFSYFYGFTASPLFYNIGRGMMCTLDSVVWRSAEA